MDRQFPCSQCGADLNFKPGADALVCSYCGHEESVVVADAQIEELEYRAHLETAAQDAGTHEVLTVRCTNCAAETTLDPSIVSDLCPFCGSALVSTERSVRLMKPQAVLPFNVPRDEAEAAFRKWLHGRWFAPNALKQYARREDHLSGIYIPHWTYDARTTTDYSGRRGDDYYVSESYSVMENGRSVRKTRQVRKTRWTSVSGRVRNEFDDVLVPASDTLPPKLIRALVPWDVDQLVPVQDAYLSGFRTESYRIGLEAGFEEAKSIMDGTIRSTIHRDIGGDHQQIVSKRTRYQEVSFKHVLFPIWISAYQFHDKTYRFLINARTGEVQGERPWSAVKITLAVIVAVIVIIVLVLVLGETQ